MDQVMEWLLDSDPAIRWQVMRDLTGDRRASTERSRISEEGWGSRLLAAQTPDGMWGGGAYSPKWISTTYSLLLLRHFEPDPSDERVVDAVDRVRHGVDMRGPFFEYSREMCITGMVLALRSYFFADPSDPPQVGYVTENQRDDG
ncbi:MAG TPA: squalene cyclase, partial [Acidimicrobiia bacterium]